MVDLTPFRAGIDAARKFIPCADPRSAFIEQLALAGYHVKSLKFDDIDRIASPNQKNPKGKDGWYVYREIDFDGELTGFGCYGCWITNDKFNWQSRSEQTLSMPDRLKFHAAREAMRLQVENETKKRHLEAAARAYDIYTASPECNGHPYLSKKGIGPSEGLKIAQDGRLVIPVTLNDQLISLQFVPDDGKEKRFLAGSTTKGGYFILEGDNARVFIAEGYATAKSIQEATGNTVYIAFSSGNMTETAMTAAAQRPNSVLFVAGDNGNGAKQAQQAAQAANCEAIFPPDEALSDFNDYHAAYGLDALKTLFGCGDGKQAYQAPVKTEMQAQEFKPSGVMLDIYNYYNATSGNDQKGFAIQTALAITSIACGRAYKTEWNNYASLYLMCIGKSGTGKEHPKTVIENILYAADLGHLIGGDGYTSAGAVFSALLDKPRHITVIDELGRYLEAGKEGKQTSNQREANTKIMEAIGRAHGVIRPPTYSTMTVGKDAAQGIKNRQIYNPHITLVGMSTPSTLFATLDMASIKDGFVNRFIISISEAERTIRTHRPLISVPARIIEWIKTIEMRYGAEHLPTEPTNPVVLQFSDEADKAQKGFQEYCIEIANNLDRFGMSELTGRSNEMALRISMLCALSENPYAETIERKHMDWAISYVKRHLEDTISRLKITISGSEYEGNKKEILAALREAGAEGMTWAQMQKQQPYSKFSKRDLTEILISLRDAELAYDESYVSPKGGRPTMRWVAQA
jgi:phage/plasmid primase-like uncharacterized protein